MENNDTIIESKPLIIDCTLYNGEPITEFRLKYLYPVVDYFVITEANQTFRGKNKEELYFDKFKHIFEPYEDKIIRVKADVAGNCANWVKEASQREQGQKYVSEHFKGKKYIVLACDIDEIPSREFITDIWQYYDRCKLGLHIHMEMFLYGFRWRLNNLVWKMPFIISDQGIMSDSFHFIRERQHEEYIKSTGWHITYCLNMADMVRKLESYCHTEFDTPQNKKTEYIRLCMLTGRSFFNMPTYKLEYYTGTFLPEGWYEFQEKMDTEIFREGVKELNYDVQEV